MTMDRRTDERTDRRSSVDGRMVKSGKKKIANVCIGPTVHLFYQSIGICDNIDAEVNG